MVNKIQTKNNYIPSKIPPLALMQSFNLFGKFSLIRRTSSTDILAHSSSRERRSASKLLWVIEQVLAYNSEEKP